MLSMGGMDMAAERWSQLYSILKGDFIEQEQLKCLQFGFEMYLLCQLEPFWHTSYVELFLLCPGKHNIFQHPTPTAWKTTTLTYLFYSHLLQNKNKHEVPFNLVYFAI